MEEKGGKEEWHREGREIWEKKRMRAEMEEWNGGRWVGEDRREQEDTEEWEEEDEKERRKGMSRRKIENGRD